ncbi:hypothetical protein GCM10028783_19210 [Modestobacter muralis]
MRRACPAVTRQPGGCNPGRWFRGIGDLGMGPWPLDPPDGDPVLGGLAVPRLVDGRIAQFWTVLDGGAEDQV